MFYDGTSLTLTSVLLFQIKPELSVVLRLYRFGGSLDHIIVSRWPVFAFYSDYTADEDAVIEDKCEYSLPKH